jgi:hypothetical protein
MRVRLLAWDRPLLLTQTHRRQIWAPRSVVRMPGVSRSGRGRTAHVLLPQAPPGRRGRARPLHPSERDRRHREPSY